MELFKTATRLKRERNDRIVAAAFHDLRKKYPKESNATLFATIALDEHTPYSSVAGVRSSLIRTNTITTR